MLNWTQPWMNFNGGCMWSQTVLHLVSTKSDAMWIRQCAECHKICALIRFSGWKQRLNIKLGSVCLHRKFYRKLYPVHTINIKSNSRTIFRRISYNVEYKTNIPTPMNAYGESVSFFQYWHWNLYFTQISVQCVIQANKLKNVL